MTYADRLLEQWQKFDELLARLEVCEKLHWCVYTVRNLYVANQEIGIRDADIKGMTKTIIYALKLIVFTLVKKPVLTSAAQAILLEIHPEKDADMAKRLNIALARIAHITEIRLKNILRLRFIATWAKASWLLLRSPLNKIVILQCLPEMLLGLYVYHLLDLGGVRIIVTQRDRYPIELAVLKKAREMGAPSIRTEDFMSLGAINRNTIACEYYFCPNHINKEIFQSFPQNRSVIFVDGGFPYWDRLSSVQYTPDQDPKLILFMTQYGMDLGIFGEKGPAFYVEEIISVLPEGYNLLIKPHPLDSIDAYQRYVSDRVRLIRPGEIDNAILFSRSTHVFSIASQASVEAKHICPNAYFINYDPAGISDMDYRLLTDYIDLITNREELNAFLQGTRQAMPQRRFIDFFNPAYPHTSNKLRQLIDSLA